MSHVETRRSSGDERGLILQLRPGVLWSSRSGRLRGSLSYAADLQHDSARSRGDISHVLGTAFTAEAVENWFFIDGSASASRRSVSAFGVQADPSTPSRVNDNQADVASASLRPNLRGILGGVVSYNVGAYSSVSRTRKSVLGDVDEAGADFALASLGGGLVGWGLNGSRQRVKFSSGRSTDSERLVANVNLRPDVDWMFMLRAGQESTDIASLDKRRYNNWGASLRWTPSPRTVLSADVDQRYFGRSWNLSLEHRLALSTLRLSSTRGSSSSGTSGGDVTNYQFYYAQFASLQPDPVLRDQGVRDFLRLAQIDPNALVRGGSLVNAVSLQRRTDLSWTYSAARLTMALQASSGDFETLDKLAPQLGDGAVSQRGLSASAGWRLTPTASANVSLSHFQTADRGGRSGNDLNSVAIGVSDQIGLRATASLNARHSRFSGGPDPYRETAIGAALSYRF